MYLMCSFYLYIVCFALTVYRLFSVILTIGSLFVHDMVISVLFHVSDVNSVEHSFSYMDNTSFFVCGQLCKFIRKHASRCLASESVPLETDWLGLLSLNLTTAAKLSPQQFLHKMRLETKLATACKR